VTGGIAASTAIPEANRNPTLSSFVSFARFVVQDSSP
jgi:hypothetical protein